MAVANSKPSSPRPVRRWASAPPGSSRGRLDQRLRGALAADDSHRALARRLSPALLHQPGDARSQPSPVHAVLQLRATTAWLPRLRPHPGDNLPRRPGSSTLSSCSLWDGESVNTKPSLDSLVDVRSGDA